MIVWRTKNIAIIIYNSYDVHEIWCANDITVYSENNVIIFFHELNFLINFSFKKIPISPFVQLAQFWYSSFSWLFVSYLLWPIFGSPFSPLNKGEGIKLWPNNWFPKVLIKSSNFFKSASDTLAWSTEMSAIMKWTFAVSKILYYFRYKIDWSKNVQSKTLVWKLERAFTPS